MRSLSIFYDPVKPSYYFCSVFVSGIFDIFNLMCEQYHRNASIHFLNGEKNGTKNFKCEQGFNNIDGKQRRKISILLSFSQKRSVN